MAGPLALLLNSACRTLTNTRRPVRPSFTVMSAMPDSRRTVSPTRTGWWNCSWLPAHMRRGKGTGGMKPPLVGWPSSPASLCR